MQEEILSEGFDNHHFVINNILNEQLKMEIVTKTVLEVEFKSLQAETTAAMKLAQQAASKNKKMRADGRLK